MDAKIDDLGRRARRTFGAGLVAFAAACGGPREEVEPPRPQVAEEVVAPALGASNPGERTEPVATGPCLADAPRVVYDLATSPSVLGIAVSGERGLVVFPDGPSTMRTVAVTIDAAPGPARTLGIGNAEGLRVVAAVGEGFVVVTDGPCADGHTRCLTAALLDTAGASIGAPVVVGGHAPIARIRRHTTDEALLLAFSTDGGAPWVDSFVRTASGLVHARHALERVPREDKQDEVLAITGTHQRFTVLHRLGSAEDPDGALVLESATRSATIDALEEAAMIERFVPDGEGFGIIASFEFDRPLALRVRADGTLSGPARRVEGDAPLPPPFDDALVAQLVDDGATLTLALRAASGDAVGRVPIDARPDGRTRAASVARTRHGFLVPYVAKSASGHSLVARAVRCREQG